MPRDSHVEVTGVVSAALGGGQYDISLDGRADNIRAQLSGRMKRNHVRVIPGDKVRVALSPYDLSHGIITYRNK